MTAFASRGAGEQHAPIRAVHLGLGNFFRAHQAWYTAHAPDAADWGIAAFTGSSTRLAEDLNGQDGLYTLITRSPDGDSAEVVASLCRAHAGPDTAALLRYLADPSVSVVTLTVTEAGYARRADGRLDQSRPEVVADLDALTAEVRAPELSTTPGRLVAGLRARRAAGAGPLAIVSCDNLPDNGQVIATVVDDLANLLDPDLAGWIDRNVSFVTTVVDRITPATTDRDRMTALELTGRIDAAPVVTEPFSEWVLCGEFPAGHPGWDAVGARIVDDIAPFEERKLWMLNGGHSLLAYAGSARGHLTIAQAMADPVCRGWLDEWWQEVMPYLRLPVAERVQYREALVARFTNAAMQHLLAQIATDGSQKISVRILPILRREREGGRMPAGAVRAVASWVNHLRGAGAPIKDATADVVELATGSLSEAALRVLQFLAPDLATDDDLVAAVAVSCRNLGGE